MSTQVGLEHDQTFDMPGALFKSKLAAHLEDGRYSDIEIKCGEKTWSAHKVVLCSHSDWFRNACKEHFKSGQECRITFPEDEFCEVTAMMEYCYTFVVDSSDAINTGLFYSRLFAFADQYALDELAVYAHAKFSGLLPPQLIIFSDELAPTIHHIYSSTPETRHELRDCVVTAAARHFADFLSVPELKQVVDEVAGLGREIAVEMDKITKATREGPRAKRQRVAERDEVYANLERDPFDPNHESSSDLSGLGSEPLEENDEFPFENSDDEDMLARWDRLVARDRPVQARRTRIRTRRSGRMR